MATELINPNIHVALIHYPLALLIIGTGIEVFSFLWKKSSFHTAGRWMILLGALSAVPGTFSGIYALSDIAHRNNPAGEAPWVDVKSSSPVVSQAVTWSMLKNHMLLQSIATGLCVIAAVTWLGCSDLARKSLHIPLLVVLLFGVSIIVRGAWFGGEAVYTKGVGVESPSGPTPPKEDGPRYAFERYFPLVEMHVTMAGTAVAIALASIGLSIRKITATYSVNDTRPIIPTGQTMANRGPREPPSSVSMARSFNPDIEVSVQPFAPAARFWLLTFCIALFTLLGGWFIIASDSDAFNVAKHTKQPLYKVLWEQVRPDSGEKINRAVAHIGSGTVIVLVPLILATLARFAPRRRFWFSFFTLILIVAVAAQVWLGVLMLYDTPEGPVTRFNAASEVPTTRG